MPHHSLARLGDASGVPADGPRTARATRRRRAVSIAAILLTLSGVMSSVSSAERTSVSDDGPETAAQGRTEHERVSWELILLGALAALFTLPFAMKSFRRAMDQLNQERSNPSRPPSRTSPETSEKKKE
jgi:hypothetical protein